MDNTPFLRYIDDGFLPNFQLLLLNAVEDVVTKLSILLSILLAISCTKKPELSTLAQVKVGKIESIDFDTLEINLSSNGFEETFRLSPETDIIDISVPSGSYRLSLHYFKDYRKIYSSSFCRDHKENEQVHLVNGDNNVVIKICSRDHYPITDPDEDSVDQEDELEGLSFYIHEGRLLDHYGNDFLIRGINLPVAFHKEKSMTAIPHIKELGFNAVRITWCADNLVREGLCEQKDMHSIEDLKRVLNELKKHKLVAIINLQNATGSSEKEHLVKMVDYYLKPEVTSLLKDFSNMTIVNIANEFYGNWDKSENYLLWYKEAITKIREADLSHVLMIDSRGWGQDTSSIVEYSFSLLEHDPNLLFSAHVYDAFQKNSGKVEELFEYVREHKIPFAVGEFACKHYPTQGDVDCEAVMEQSQIGNGYGYIGWSYSGNTPELTALDVVSSSDWISLTPWGETLVNHPSGVLATSMEASIF